MQTAAVAVKWVQALDRRDGSLTHRTEHGAGRREKLVRDHVPASCCFVEDTALDEAAEVTAPLPQVVDHALERTAQRL